MVRKKTSWVTFFILVLFFIVSSAFVLSYPYPMKRTHEHYEPRIWTGGTIPDEHAYFRWAQIYYETGKTYVPLEEIGSSKVQHVDFYIGDSPGNCVFAKVDVSRDKRAETIWEIRSRNITVTVYNGKGEGISGEFIEIREERRGMYWKGFSDEDGRFYVENVPPGVYSVKVETKGEPLKIHFATDYPDLDYPITVVATLKNWSPTTVNIHVDHYINPDLGDVRIYLGFDWERKDPEGYTNEEGDFLLHLPFQSKMYHVVAVKETSGIPPPEGSVVVKVEDGYAIANRWPPGYCYLIIPFWISNMIDFINIFACALACVSTYYLAKRLYNQKTAEIAALLVIVCSLAMVMIYGRGMADYAAMAFAAFGITLFIESIRDNDVGENKKLLLGFLGGLSFASAVTMRYSTIVILLGPLIYGFIKLVKKPPLKIIKKALLFILGMLVIGSLLASYNTYLFGGPLNSGYQMSTRVEIGEDGNASIETPEETMFEQYFRPSWDSLRNAIDRILPQLYLLLPTLFIAPLGLDFRKNRTWLLFLWILPILVIYMQMTWVGKVPVEDMRYFLPVLPPTAILSAYATNRIGKNKVFISALLALLIIIGFLMAHYGINWQIHRHELGWIFNPPSIAVVIATLTYLLIYAMVLSKKLLKSFST
jgi:hypothetical protein